LFVNVFFFNCRFTTEGTGQVPSVRSPGYSSLGRLTQAAP
jgi:hypothetical protein